LQTEALQLTQIFELDSEPSQPALKLLVIMGPGDCSETPDGKLLVFEVDSGAVVHSMDSAELFPYKAPQMESVFAAFRKMLRTRASQGMKGMAA